MRQNACEWLHKHLRSARFARLKRTGVLLAVLVLGVGAACGRAPRTLLAPGSLVLADANDNRVPAGVLRGGVLHLELDAMWAGWHPDLDVDSAVSVQAFAERGKNPSIPGPLLRVPEGTEVRVSLRNLITDSTLVVRGLRPGASGDSISIRPGETREISFRAGEPGTYHYWGTTSHARLQERMGRDALLSGVIVIDSAGARLDPAERIFVISLIDIFPPSDSAPSKEEVWEIAVNGRSWPHTERLSYATGDTARWRLVNATNRPHPMHLHGFHFRVTAKGDGTTDTTYAEERRRYAVTELVNPGGTFQLEWALTRPGRWLVHCHMIPHIVPFPERVESVRRHDVHAVAKHPEVSMAGLVLGVEVKDPRRAYVEPREPDVAVHRLFIQEARADPGQRSRKGFVLQRGAEPARDSVVIPGTPLVVVRGQRNRVTIVNRLSAPSSVHWHGMELESLFDGVAGYSGLGGSRAPLLAPGDSFTVWFTPPRAGTYMFHSHMDEEDQLASGMYAPLIVLEPGQRYDPETDLTMMIGLVPDDRGGSNRALNGSRSPAPISLRAGRTYRLRLINMLLAPRVDVQLVSGSAIQQWRLVSKDGATVPPALSAPRRARFFIGVGETYDFEWTPPPGESSLNLQVVVPPGNPVPPLLTQKIIVAP